ncbi:glycan-binding surface protein [Cytophagaceae bacterium YF14B1]|uniref:Glycan-binding surface protein n=1 Tax=Xanthocytophaga flava TaxID=3048013 RepID=A0AAE3UD81_9BACT|nr:glycan-binding surface protein [Xanthocytophaga flavus]MDJ1486303.1 glycan-binding surface protein [Xanthocytophaga flavus]
MKNISIHIRTLLYWSVLLTISVSFNACKDEELGAPVIKQVRMLDPATKDSTFTQTYPGTLIAIQGENLAGAKNIYFNDYNASFNPVYNTNQTIIITIPAEAPTEATESSVPNTLRIVTTHGETTFSFTLLPPKPVISSIYNENGLPGSKMTITGANFYLVEKITFPGNVEVTEFTVSEDAEAIEVTIPASLTTSGSVKVTTKYGDVESSAPVNFYTGSGVLCNFDDVNTLIWGCATSNDNTKFPGGHGNYALMEFAGIGAGDGGWWNTNRSINTGSAQWVSAGNLNDGIANYSLKFEIYIKEEWKVGSILIAKDGNWNNYMARYAPWSGGDNSSSSTAYTTTIGWHTVTIPLTDFKKTKDGSYDDSGSAPTSLTQVLGESGAGGINFYFVNDGSEAVKTFSTAVDNIRVVKNIQ